MNKHENNNGKDHENSDPRISKEQALDLFEIKNTETEIKQFDVAVGEANELIDEARQELTSIDQSIEATRSHLFDEKTTQSDHERLSELFKQTSSSDPASILEAANKYEEIARTYLNRIAYLVDLRKKKIRARSNLYESILQRDNLRTERTKLELRMDELENAYFSKYNQTPNGGQVFINSSLLREMMRYSAN